MKKLNYLSLTVIIIGLIAFACKKTTTITVVKNKAPELSAPLAEITSIYLLQMPKKGIGTIASPEDWDAGQYQEDLGADVIINILDSVPYYSIFSGGYVRFNLTNDSLPKIYGGKTADHTFKIRNYNEKFHLLMLDWDKNTEAEQMALIPFRFNTYTATKPAQILLTNTDSTAKVLLNVIWY